MENMNYYAKPIVGEEGSYETHVMKCYEIACAEMEQVRKTLIDFLSRLGIDAEKYIRQMKIAVLFHDTGKLNHLFQRLMNKLINQLPISKNDYFRHELISCLLLICLETDSFERGEILIILLYPKSSKPLTGDLRSFVREMCNKEWPIPGNEEIEYAIKAIENLAAGVFI